VPCNWVACDLCPSFLSRLALITVAFVPQPLQPMHAQRPPGEMRDCCAVSESWANAPEEAVPSWPPTARLTIVFWNDGMDRPVARRMMDWAPTNEVSRQPPPPMSRLLKPRGSASTSGALLFHLHKFHRHGSGSTREMTGRVMRVRSLFWSGPGEVAEQARTHDTGVRLSAWREGYRGDSRASRCTDSARARAHTDAHPYRWKVLGPIRIWPPAAMSQISPARSYSAHAHRKALKQVGFG
jgi:hypothetical protein